MLEQRDDFAVRAFTQGRGACFFGRVGFIGKPKAAGGIDRQRSHRQRAPGGARDQRKYEANKYEAKLGALSDAYRGVHAASWGVQSRLFHLETGIPNKLAVRGAI
jgi:hypothetical protein